MIEIVVKSLTWLEREVKVAYNEFNFILYTLDNLKHLGCVPLFFLFWVERSLSLVRFV